MNNSNDNATSLTKQTSVTIALALAMCAGAFWTGKTTESLRAKLETEVRIRELEHSGFSEWKEDTQKILEKLTQIAQDNQHRLQRVENNLNGNP